MDLCGLSLFTHISFPCLFIYPSYIPPSASHPAHRMYPGLAHPSNFRQSVSHSFPCLTFNCAAKVMQCTLETNRNTVLRHGKKVLYYVLALREEECAKVDVV